MIPSAFFFLGPGSGTDPPTDCGLHHAHFALDETVSPRGMEHHVNLAIQVLAKLANGEDVAAAAAAAAAATAWRHTTTRGHNKLLKDCTTMLHSCMHISS